MTFDEPTKSEILHRSRGNCELRLPGCTQRATVFHHRQLRRHGNHTATNALHLCDPCHTGTRGVHSSGIWDLVDPYERGWLVRSWDNPDLIPPKPLAFQHPTCQDGADTHPATKGPH